MTPFLRKYHRSVWSAFAVLLPAFFVAAILALPKPVAEPQDFSGEPEALPQVLKSVETQGFLINLRAQPASGERQIEVVVQTPLTVPAALVYLVKSADDKPETGILFGELSATGERRFNLLPTSVGGWLLIFDPVKNQVIQKFELG